jgi:hypothetical protein
MEMKIAPPPQAKADILYADLELALSRGQGAFLLNEVVHKCNLSREVGGGQGFLWDVILLESGEMATLYV